VRAKRGTPVVAETGIEAAIERASTTRFDLVICDLVMLEVSGFEVVASLKAGGRSQSTPILILTAQTLTAADRARLGHHILGIITKGPDATAGLRDWLVQAIPPDRRSEPNAA
jgi:CheY-like chemotaxis protein